MTSSLATEYANQTSFYLFGTILICFFHMVLSYKILIIIVLFLLSL